MSVNTIEQGSAIPETLDADIAAEEYFGFDRPQKILIVEGENDLDVLKSFLYLNNMDVDFEIRTAQMVDKDDNSGKKVALTYYKDNSNKQDIRLLIDRDYDFICSMNKDDEHIFYYDFYELENYIFEEEVLKLALISNGIKTEQIDKVVKFFQSGQLDFLKPLIACSKLRIFRELHKVKKVNQLEEETIREYASFVRNIDIKGCLLGKNPKYIGDTFEERFENYLKKELNEIDSDLYNVIEKEFGNLEIVYPNTFYDFFKFYFKGKDIIKFLPDLLKVSEIIKSNLNEFSSKKLLNTFIFKSELYKIKILKICSSFRS